MPLKQSEVETLIKIERTTASISVFATLILVSTFIFIKQFRTLSNTLIFYASFANLFANVAALIGGSALTHENGALCQFQSFLLEMFMQSDPFWSCAMAINVYLVFFRRYDATRLRKLYWIYGLLCYGVPFIPAMFCLFYKTEAKGRIYGNATLWCWIDNDWAAVRIYSYYAPVWIAILTTFIIYLRVGVEVFQRRSELLKAAKYNHGSVETWGSLAEQPSPESPFTGVRTTEVQVTTDLWTDAAINKSIRLHHTEQLSPQTTPHDSMTKDQYSITISSSNPHSSPLKISSKSILPRRPSSMDKIKWAYTKCALLFAISILITWVPASINRVHGLRYPKNPSFALNVGSALVLPLQGFWNSIIYFVTSLGICRSVLKEWKERRNDGCAVKNRSQEKRNGTIDIVHLGGRRETWEGRGRLPPRRPGRGEWSDSMLELSEKKSVSPPPSMCGSTNEIKKVAVESDGESF